MKNPGVITTSRYEEWDAEWLRRHGDRWVLRALDPVDPRPRRLFPAPLRPLEGGPRVLPPSNESVKTIRALEAITMTHVPLKET